MSVVAQQVTKRLIIKMRNIAVCLPLTRPTLKATWDYEDWHNSPLG